MLKQQAADLIAGEHGKFAVAAAHANAQPVGVRVGGEYDVCAYAVRQCGASVNALGSSGLGACTVGNLGVGVRLLGDDINVFSRLRGIKAPAPVRCPSGAAACKREKRRTVLLHKRRVEATGLCGGVIRFVHLAADHGQKPFFNRFPAIHGGGVKIVHAGHGGKHRVRLGGGKLPTVLPVNLIPL